MWLPLRTYQCWGCAVKRLFAWLGIILLIGAMGFYQWSEEIADGRRLPAGNSIEVRIASGGVKIVGKPGTDVRVSIGGVSPELAATAKVHIDRDRRPILVEISDLPRGSEATVELPESASVAVSMLAGDLNISGMRGDTRALLRAGLMTIHLGSLSDVGTADGFVLAGNLDASAFRVDKGGIWRMFRWRGSGKSTIDAHVTSGELVIE
jgi:hypothetical protein